MPKPKVSVLMSTYNDEKYIEKAITSVMSQDYKNLEFIIVDDASTDNTRKILEQYKKKESRIKILTNTINLGISGSLNNGLHEAKGEYVARIDGDDYWIDKEKLTIQVDFLEKKPEYSLVGTWANVVDKDGNLVYVIKYPLNNDEIKSKMLRENCFLSSSILIRMENLTQVQLFNVDNLAAQDYDLWLELGKRRKLGNIPKVTVNYRINPAGISQSKYNIQINQTIRLIQKNKNHYPNYFIGITLWNIRKYYPVWLRGRFSSQIKSLIKSLFKS